MDERSGWALAFEMAWHGDLGPARALAGELSGVARDEGAAWALLVRAHEHLTGAGDAPALGDFLALSSASPEARGTAALALALVARCRLLAYDRAGLDAAFEVLEALERGSGLTRATLWVEVTRLWREALSGLGGELGGRLDALSAGGSRAQLPEIVIEANVLRVAVTLNALDLPSATLLARRVSRMARAEGVPHEEYLAHFLLARVRRLGDRAHLASRILGALYLHAPAVWHPWLGWELCLCGDALPDGAVGPGARAQALMRAFAAGDAGAIDAHAIALRAGVAGFRGVEREAAALIAALDPRVPVSALGRDLAAWATGATETLPFGLGGAVSSVPSLYAEIAGHSWVLVSPGAASRRFLHPGMGVLRGMPMLEQTARRHGRTETATAVLALAGPAGLSIRKFVSEVYGFAYARDAHDGVLRVLLHRMRKGLESVATIERTEDHIVLRAAGPFLVPDPRTSAPSSDRALRMIATRPGASARDVASALGMPLRTVQAVLAQLVADGSCLAARAQTGLEYRLEDTTFSDPTLTGKGTLDEA